MRALLLLAALVTAQTGKTLVTTRKGLTFEVFLSDGGRYATVTKAQALAVWAARDGGTVRDAVESLGVMLLDGTADNCSCADGVSSCLVDLPDGGAGVAPVGVTLRGAVGPGCVLKPCVQLFGDGPGDGTWPSAQCPSGP